MSTLLRLFAGKWMVTSGYPTQRVGNAKSIIKVWPGSWYVMLRFHILTMHQNHQYHYISHHNICGWWIIFILIVDNAYSFARACFTLVWRPAKCHLAMYVQHTCMLCQFIKAHITKALMIRRVTAQGHKLTKCSVISFEELTCECPALFPEIFLWWPSAKWSPDLSINIYSCDTSTTPTRGGSLFYIPHQPLLFNHHNETKWPPFCRRCFQMNFLVIKCCICTELSLRMNTKDPINDKPALAHIMVWRRTKWHGLLTNFLGLNELINRTTLGNVSLHWMSSTNEFSR